MPNQALPVYLGQPGDRAALANAVVVDSLAAAIDHQIDADAHKPSQVKGIVPKLPKPSSLARAQVVANVSHEAELDPLQVDTAIRNLALGRKDRFNMDLPLFQKFATDYVAMLPDSTMVQYVQRGKMN
jgi:hypothetical protein